MIRSVVASRAAVVPRIMNNMNSVTNNMTNNISRTGVMMTTRRAKSASPLEGDAGSLATHAHHKMTTFLVVATPIYLILPNSHTMDKIFGSALAISFAAHSWIGLNYVATDYVPKISKSLLGPARMVNAGIGLVTLVGMGAMAFNGKGGIKGTVYGLWNGNKKTTKE